MGLSINMKKFILDMFSESSNVSMMRVLALICVLTAAILALRASLIGGDLTSVSILCSTFLGAGIGGKVLQRPNEGTHHRVKR